VPIEGARTTLMFFVILIEAFIVANFICYTSMPADLSAFAVRFNATPWLVVAAICVIDVGLGPAREALSNRRAPAARRFPSRLHDVNRAARFAWPD